MRITNSMMVQTMIRNLNRNMVRLNDKQTQFSTGKRINRPSDDPLGISKSLRLRTDIASMEQYRRNVNDAASFMDNTETALRNMLEGMQRIRELAVQAANGTLTGEETAKMRAEVGEIKNQLIDLANYTHSGKHIFSGKKTGEPLLDRNGHYRIDLTRAADPRMTDDQWAVAVSTRETIQVNTLGFEVFEAETREVIRTDITGGGGFTLQLPRMDGSGFITLRLAAGSGAGPARQPDGTWTVGADWQPEGSPMAADHLVTHAFAQIREIVGPLMGAYSFSLENRTDWNGTGIQTVEYLKATPLNAVIADRYEARAVWQVDLTDALTEEDFGGTVPPTLTFNGTELIFHRGDPTADPAGIALQDPPTNSNRMVLTVNGDVSSLTVAHYTDAVAGALSALSALRGSEVAGFQFSAAGATVTAIAPIRSGSRHNTAFFGGSLSLEAANLNPAVTPREAQRVIAGTSPARHVTAGQQAGLFVTLDKLMAGLETGRQEDVSNLLGRLDAHINTILTVRSVVGAKANRLDLITNRIEDDVLNFRDLMSKIEDADMSKVIIELMNEENVYRSALAVGARIIQPTLLDFLR